MKSNNSNIVGISRLLKGLRRHANYLWQTNCHIRLTNALTEHCILMGISSIYTLNTKKKILSLNYVYVTKYLRNKIFIYLLIIS